MKTAAKALLAVFVGFGMGCVAPAFAEGVTTPTVSTAPASQTPGAMPKIATPDMGVTVSNPMPPPSLDPVKDRNGRGDPKIPDSVKNVVKRLNATSEDVTLEDLNAAREAVAKLDILIDIEKRLTDLSNIRQEREEKSMANAIPASALGLRSGAPPALPAQPFPVVPAAAPLPVSMPAPAAPMPTESIVIERIMGASGHYVALIKIGEGKQQQVRVGDKTADGSIVQAITDEGVTLLRGKKEQTIQVKDVSAIFGGR
jgi:type IV pilus biogenesis protein PilP